MKFTTLLKRLACVAIIATLVVSMVACSNNEPTEQPSWYTDLGLHCYNELDCTNETVLALMETGELVITEVCSSCTNPKDAVES